MKTEVNQISPCKREVHVEVPPENLKDEYNLLCERYRQKAKVPGFRPGKAPLSVVLRHYRASLREDFLEHAVQNHLLKALEGENLSPLGTPKVQELKYEDGGTLSFSASFEVLPKLEISNYRGLEVQRILPEVKEEEIENTLGQMQERLAEFTPIEERAIQDGDFAVVAYKGTYLDGSRSDFESKETYIEVGGKSTIEEFTRNLQGARPGETKIFSVSYPADYPGREMAGKEVRYVVQVQALKSKKIPELNDDFAKNVGDYNSLEELRVKIRQDLQASKGQAARKEMEEKLLETILDLSPFEVPQALVERQTEVRMNEYVRGLIMRGIHPQTLDVNWSDLRQQQRQRAEHDVRVSLLLDYIADQESLEVSDEELEEEIVKRAREAKQSVEAFKSRLTKDGGADRIKTRIRNRKTMDLLLSLASFKDPQGIIFQS